MMPQAEALYDLQQIDLQTLRSHKRIDEINTALADNDAVIAAQTAVDTAQKTLAPLKTRMRDLELEIQTTQGKAQTTEDRLYSGTVKNPKELQEMQDEIASLKKRAGDLEEALLEQMMAVEAAEEDLKERESVLAGALAQAEEQHRDLVEEKGQLEAKLAQLTQQRENALKQVTAESLKTYDNLRPKKANQPIAALKDRSCGVCGIEQTMAIAQEVRRGRELVPCLNCGRLLAAVRG